MAETTKPAPAEAAAGHPAAGSATAQGPRLNTAAIALTPAKVTPRYAHPNAHAAGWKAVSAALALALIGTAGVGGWYVSSLKAKLAPAPSEPLPADLVSARAEITKLRDQLAQERTAAQLVTAELETKGKRLAALEAGGAGAGELERARADLAGARKRADDAEAALTRATMAHEAALARQQAIIDGLTRDKQLAAGQALADAERTYKAEVEALRAKVAGLTEQLATATAGSLEGDKAKTQLAATLDDLAKAKAIVEALRKDNQALSQTAADRADALTASQRETTMARADLAKARDDAAKAAEAARRELADARRAADLSAAQAEALKKDLAAAKARVEEREEQVIAAEKARREAPADARPAAAAGDPPAPVPAADPDEAKLRDQLADARRALAEARAAGAAAEQKAREAQQIAQDAQKSADAANRTADALAEQLKTMKGRDDRTADADRGDQADRADRPERAEKVAAVTPRGPGLVRAGGGPFVPPAPASSQGAPGTPAGLALASADEADAARAAQLAKDNRQRYTAKGKITKVTLAHNVVIDGQPGMLVKVSYTVNGLKHLRGLLAAWVVDDHGRLLQAAAAAPGSARDASGNLVSSSRFTVGFDHAAFTDEQLFFPYSAFPTPGEGKSLRAKVRVMLFSGDASAEEAQYKLASDESQGLEIGGR